MLQQLMSFVKDERFQTALVAAVLGALSAFALSFWGIHLDFPSTVKDVQQQDVSTVVEEQPVSEAEQLPSIEEVPSQPDSQFDVLDGQSEVQE
jgi:hypothetical protein